MLQRSLFVLWILCLPALVQAQVPVDFYATSVAVDDRSSNNFRKALREALVQVLSKASGAPADFVRSRPQLQQDLAQGDKLASQFVYYQQAIVLANGTEQSQLRLKVSFPESRVMALLQQGGLTFWAPPRPEIYFWLVYQKGTAIVFVDQELILKRQWQLALSQPILQWGIKVASHRPQALNAQRLWQMDESYRDALLNDAEGKPILLAKIDTATDAQVVGTVSFVGRSGSQLIQAARLDLWVDQAMQWANQQLAARFSVQLLTEDNNIVLSVAGVENYAQYEQLMALIESIDTVRSVYVLSNREQDIRLAISFKTEAEQLKQRLLKGGKLLPSQTADDNLYLLHMHWNH